MTDATDTSNGCDQEPSAPRVRRLLLVLHRRRGLVVTAASASAVSLALRAWVPPVPLTGAEYDDRLAVGQAQALTQGDWLGRYRSYVTMAKGVGYPIFLAVCHLVGVPVLLGQQVLHLLAVAVMSLVVLLLTRSGLFAGSLFCVLALDPSFYGTEASRFVRDNWYASLCLLLFALLARPRVKDGSEFPPPRRGLWMAGYVTACIVTGAAAAAYWVGREERPWLLPALLLLLLARLVGWLVETRDGRRTGARFPPRRLILPVVAGAMVLGTAVGLVGAVALENHHRYGVYLTNDTTEGQFSQAFGQWQRVQAGAERRYVPITAAMRQAVYAVSPAARELAPDMEGPVGQVFYKYGCADYHICDDVTGGWTQWALRAALFKAEPDMSAGRAQQIWGTIAIQIRRACRDGALRCRPAMPLLLPQLSSIKAGALSHSFAAATRWLVGFHMGDQTGPQRGLGRPQDWALFAQVLPDLPASPATFQRRERGFARHWQNVVQKITSLYRLLILPFFVLALVGYAIAPLRRRPDWGASYLVGCAAGLAVFCRLGLIALVDSTSFPAARTVYLLPASPLLIVFVGMGCRLLLQSLQPTRETMGEAIFAP